MKSLLLGLISIFVAANVHSATFDLSEIGISRKITKSSFKAAFKNKANYKEGKNTFSWGVLDCDSSDFDVWGKEVCSMTVDFETNGAWKNLNVHFEFPQDVDVLAGALVLGGGELIDGGRYGFKAVVFDNVVVLFSSSLDTACGFANPNSEEVKKLLELKDLINVMSE